MNKLTPPAIGAAGGQPKFCTHFSEISFLGAEMGVEK